MTTSIDWDTAEESTLIVTFESLPSWEAFNSAIEDVGEVIGQREGRVDVIGCIAPDALWPTSEGFDHIRSALSKLHHHVGLFVATSENPALRTVFATVLRASGLRHRVVMAESIAEAQTLIAKRHTVTAGVVFEGMTR